MRNFFERALAPVRRIHPAAQDGVSSVVLCVLVVALIFQAKPPRFLLGPLLNIAAPPADTYNAGQLRVIAGSPELDDAPSVEIVDVVASTPSVPKTVRAKDRRQKVAGKAKTVAAADEGGRGVGGGAPPTSAAGTTRPASPPFGPCLGSASAKSTTKHANSSGLSNGTGHGCG